MEERIDDLNDTETPFYRNIYQPAREIVDTEENYLSSLKLVSEKYIPLKCQPLPGLEIPKTLEGMWNILWGNWQQLFEYHTSLLTRMRTAVDNDIDSLAQLFIDGESRLLAFYSKYCENYRKANYLAEQHKEFFTEVKRLLNDKQDLQSHLIKPVQRIMRYQLPMASIVKYAERMDLPSLVQWRRALKIMKEIPSNAQLILEASRIDNFDGRVVALGKVRIRSPLRIALDTNKSKKNFGRSASVTDKNDLFTFQERFVFLFDQRLIITEELKPKRQTLFSESSYLHIDSISINHLRFEEHWRPGGRLYTRLRSMLSASSSSNTNEEDPTLKFVLHDLSFGKDYAYIVDPGSMEMRESWLVELRALKEEKENLLQALQNPQTYGQKNYSSEGGSPKNSPTSNRQSFLSRIRSDDFLSLRKHP